MFGAVVRPAPTRASKSSNSNVTFRVPSPIVNMSRSWTHGMPLPSSAKRNTPARVGIRKPKAERTPGWPGTPGTAPSASARLLFETLTMCT